METLTLTPVEAETLLAARARALCGTGARTVLGIAGGPGVGKSSLATRLVATLNATVPGLAAYVPMDGFHMRHAKLEALGTAADKGMPHTFEGAAFATFLASLKAANTAVSGPGYSRKIEDVVDDAFTVAPETQLLVVEGNYLLIADPPWHAVRPLIDLAVFLDVPREIVRARLMKRHAEEGLFTEERNRAHIERVDLANYDLVSGTRQHADLVLSLVTPT
jgi:pantothenate kinase